MDYEPLLLFLPVLWAAERTCELLSDECGGAAMLSQAVWFLKRWCQGCNQTAQHRIFEAVTPTKPQRIVITATCQSCGKNSGRIV